MRIEGFMAALGPEALRSSSGGSRLSKDRIPASENPRSASDTVQISDEARKRLEKVRERIDRGFYNSESVAEDISDKLGEVIDNITP